MTIIIVSIGVVVINHNNTKTSLTENVFEEGEKLLGASYQVPPNIPDTFDSASFVWYVYQNCGIKNWERKTAQTAQSIYEQCIPITESEAKAGDLIFFQDTYENGNEITHVGIYDGKGKMLHAGDVVKYSDTDNDYWQQHFYGFGRLN